MQDTVQRVGSCLFLFFFSPHSSFSNQEDLPEKMESSILFNLNKHQVRHTAFDREKNYSHLPTACW